MADKKMPIGGTFIIGQSSPRKDTETSKVKYGDDLRNGKK